MAKRQPKIAMPIGSPKGDTVPCEAQEPIDVGDMVVAASCCGNCAAWKRRQGGACAPGRCYLYPEPTSHPASHWCAQHKPAPQTDHITETSP